MKRIILWVARLASLPSIAYMVFMMYAHLFGTEPHNSSTSGEMVALLFFPTGVVMGLLIAWLWDGIGGMITIGSIVAFHTTMLVLHGKSDFDLLIDGLAAPGLLFLFYWLLSRNRKAVD